ncbi:MULTISPECIES: PD-(D/E)XK nuclease family protein [Pseudochrobactrum]|uniref:PD-(D/E)XK nuclease family protein n=1 Tax=Pseudochrobactrum kiredjianiae TaxID=386305 RepID=A0ABW3V0V3_9HYPH|nr:MULTISPECIES: PD-(D/E)XK nuclease family protein [Pseudochrobactrum]MDM7852094.1 PD-(D/E)XK nuclease family protein [Pseudochrobactrum kiredjianiae]MDM8345824.1 PD-(D/E)XK nuclease family protein [Pseudochrobactrum sp. sp1633]
MNDEFIPTLSHATERDIDLLLVEELHSSLEFTTWIAAQAGILSPIASWDVKHSKRRTRSRREIDIFVDIYHQDKSRSAILIENKLDASEQPDQAESYREELATLDGAFQNRSMLITCPEAYSRQHHNFTSKFDSIVSYETISDFFRKLLTEVGSDLVLRYSFRSAILDQAIYKHRRGYTPIPDKVVGDFNAKYVALLAILAPEIIPGPSMRKSANPRESTSMIFDQAASFSKLPEVIRPRRFAHELGRGSEHRANYVAITFAGWGAALPHVLPQLNADASNLGAIFTADKPTKNRPNPGMKMLLPTEPVDNQKDFDKQTESLKAGILKAKELRDWLLSHQEILHTWNMLIKAK